MYPPPPPICSYEQNMVDGGKVARFIVQFILLSFTGICALHTVHCTSKRNIGMACRRATQISTEVFMKKVPTATCALRDL